MPQQRFFRLLCMLAIATLYACAAVTDPTRNWTPEKFYKEGKEALQEGNFQTAIQQFETLEARYPYGTYTKQAQIEVAYAYYKAHEPELAIAAANRFIQLHPTDRHVDYAYYLKGLANFEQYRGFVKKIFRGASNVSDYDIQKTRQSLSDFEELTKRFPNSIYAADARKRIVFLYNALAEAEIRVAKFYYDRGAYVATASRCKYALENYPRSQNTAKILQLLADAYDKLELNQLRDDTLRVLRKNYPHSQS